MKLLGLRTGPNPQHDGRPVSGEARAKSEGPAAPQSYLSVGVLAMMVMRGRSSPEVPHRAGRAQLEAGNAHRDIESGLSLEAQRL